MVIAGTTNSDLPEEHFNMPVLSLPAAVSSAICILTALSDLSYHKSHLVLPFHLRTLLMLLNFVQ